MDVIEKRARALIAAQYKHRRVSEVRRLIDPAVPLSALDYPNQRAIKAIITALSPPEGYVLVPLELPVDMEIAFMEAWVIKRRCFDDPDMQDAWAAALAARPEVP